MSITKDILLPVALVTPLILIFGIWQIATLSGSIPHRLRRVRFQQATVAMHVGVALTIFLTLALILRSCGKHATRATAEQAEIETTTKGEP